MASEADTQSPTAAGASGVPSTSAPQVTNQPSISPTVLGTSGPTTSTPSQAPAGSQTNGPSLAPTVSTWMPSQSPTLATMKPSLAPSQTPTTSKPSQTPSIATTGLPSQAPTVLTRSPTTGSPVTIAPTIDLVQFAQTPSGAGIAIFMLFLIGISGWMCCIFRRRRRRYRQYQQDVANEQEMMRFNYQPDDARRLDVI